MEVTLVARTVSPDINEWMRHLEVLVEGNHVRGFSSLVEELPPPNRNCPRRRQLLGSCERSCSGCERMASSGDRSGCKELLRTSVEMNCEQWQRKRGCQ